MAWVKSEYAGELAVLSTWLVGLAPWSVSVFSQRGFSVAALRFLPFRFQFIFGAQFTGERPFLWTWEVPGFVAASELTLGATLGAVAFGVYAVALAVSLFYYVEEERLEARSPVDPVRLFGALLGTVAVLTGAATALFVLYFPGVTLPVGAAVAAVLAVVLLRVDRA